MNREKVLEYFKGDELATDAWISKYALKDKEGNVLEETPMYMHDRMAMEFARIEKEYIFSYLKNKRDLNNLSTYGKSRTNEFIHVGGDYIENYYYNLFKDFKYIIPGGSVMSMLGNNYSIGSLSNCFVIGQPKDSSNGIMLKRTDQFNLMKRRGGVGKDLSLLRPKGSIVNNAAKTSTGASSFMDVDSHITNEVAQDGRRGALMLTIDIRHPDILDFITKKQDLTKVTGANISVKITDDFMQAVKKDEDYILRYPVDTEVTYSSYPYNELVDLGFNHYCKRVKARELWDTLVKCAYNTAEPGIMFEDKHHDYSPDGVYPQFKGITTNPCQPAWATVLTPKGIRQFKDVNINDLIWSKEGWTRIINKQSSGIKEVFEFRTTAGTFNGTKNHKIVQNGNKIEVKDAKNIDILAGETFKVISNPKMIMNGLLIGDGSVHKRSNNLIFLFIGKKDYDYFESEVKNLIIKHRKGIDECAYEVLHNITYKDLPLTYNREVPDWIFESNYSDKCNFLKGLFSANGSVYSNKLKMVRLKTSSPKLRDQVQVMLSSVGIRSYYTTNKAKLNKFRNGEYISKESYDINITTDRNIFYEKIGFIQKYKMDKLKSILIKDNNKEKSHKIISSSYISTEEVFNITVNNNSHTYWTGGLNVSNCGEIFMQPYDSCRLLHHNLSSYVKNPFTKEAEFNYKLFYENAYEALILGDNLVDLELEAISKIIHHIQESEDEDSFVELNLWKKIANETKNGRRCGIGFTALADTIAMMGFKFASDESLEIIDKIMNIKLQAELDATTDLAILRGTFEGYDVNKENSLFPNLGANPQNSFYQFIRDNFLPQYKRMNTYGRRNISWSTVAPTGTVSLMTGTSSGIEPVFMPYYMRRKKCMSNEDRVDFTDELGINYSEYPVIHPLFKQWIENNTDGSCYNANKLSKDLLNVYFESSPWYGSTSNDIDWYKRLEIQAIVQRYTTHSISSTLNLPKDTPIELIYKIYMTAWEMNLKGVTIYRDGCRSGILVNNNENNNTFKTVSAIKRPKVLKAKSYITKVKGRNYAIIIGLLENRPYEVFVFDSFDGFEQSSDATITKMKKGIYRYESKEDGNVIENLNDNGNTYLEKSCALYTSMLLRHGADIKYVIKTAKKIDDGITSFVSAMNRILSKYLPKEELVCSECGGRLIKENGCEKCLDCGSSKCNIIYSYN